jgi:hypothetical protein
MLGFVSVERPAAGTRTAMRLGGLGALSALLLAACGGAGTDDEPAVTDDGGSTVLAPSISYGVSSVVWKLGQAVSFSGPTNTGGRANFRVEPVLPMGLMLNAATGAITGTPAVAAVRATYTVTASNAAGTNSVALAITVSLYGLPAVSYATGTVAGGKVASGVLTCTKGTACSLTPETSGGAIVGCAVAPALPAGLSLDDSTCAISGVPSAAVCAPASFAVTPSSAEGDGKPVSVSIAVDDTAATIEGYSAQVVSYPANVAIAANTPTVTPGYAGTLTYSVSPALPAGLTFDATTGAVTGTPTTVAPAADFVVTVANSCGGATGTSTLSITVVSGIGLYLDGVLLTATPGTAYGTPIVLTSGDHRLTEAGSGSYTLAGEISGIGRLVVTVGAGDTVTLTGPQTNRGLAVTSGTLDISSLGYAVPDLAAIRVDAGPLKRAAWPTDITPLLTRWLSGSNPLAVGAAPPDGVAMAAWLDKSGTAHALVNQTGGNLPTYNAAARALDFTAASWLTSSYGTGGKGWALVYAAKVTSPGRILNSVNGNAFLGWDTAKMGCPWFDYGPFGTQCATPDTLPHLFSIRRVFDGTVIADWDATARQSFTAPAPMDYIWGINNKVNNTSSQVYEYVQAQGGDVSDAAFAQLQG